ncbi:TRAF3-interacting JNK-activating modulator-like, partial [Clarias magur]
MCLQQTRCDEDLLKNKIKTLEAQLQLCMKHVPQDGLTEVVLNMEKQKEEYENKAMEAIQKATEENSEAQSRLQNLHEALQVAQAESLRWQKLYEELRESSSLLKKKQDENNEQLQQLQNQLQRSRDQEESLREQCDMLQQDNAELSSAILLLEQDNQTLKEELVKFTDNWQGSWNNVAEVHKQGLESYQFVGVDNSITKQLRQTKQRLSLKDKENVMILGDLNADCGYVTNKGLKKLKLRNDPKFLWLITDEQDTTVRDKTHCAYDRIIVHGKTLISGIVPDSAQPFNFKREFSLTEQEPIFIFPLEIDIDFGDTQSDEGPNTSQTAEKDKDAFNGDSKLLTTSEQGSFDTFTNVYEQEESEESSDSSESDLTDVSPINTEFIFCLSHETNNDQDVNMMMSEASRNCTAAEEENMQSDVAAGVSPHGPVTEFSTTGDERQPVEEEHMETFDVEYQLKTSPSTSSDSQTPEDTSSETDEELPQNPNTTEQTSHCQSVDTKDEPFLAMNPTIADKYYVRDDMKEFTEEDQEQREESLADYPSDLSHSETEEPAENATTPPFTLIDLSSSGECSTDRMEDFSNAEHENFQNKDSPVLDHNSGIKDLEVESTSGSENVDVSFQKGTFDEEDVQECLTNDRNTEDDGKCSEDKQEVSDVIDQESYSSSDDHSTSKDEQNFVSSVKQEEETNHVTHHDYSTEDMVRMDNDVDYIIPDTMDRDANNLEIQNLRDLSSDVEERGFTNTNSILHDEEFKTEPTESHSRIDSGQSDTAMNDKLYSEASYDVGDARSIIPEALWSSALLMDEGNLCLDEYDWDVSAEDSYKIIPGNGENQQYTEEDLGIDDDDDDDEEDRNDRDWELEKTRIEAFYSFYGDQTEPEDDVGRNHKVTFDLDHESSECDDEDSDREPADLPDCTCSSSHSTEEESDSDLNTEDLTTLKPEYHSESDDPLERPYYPERSRMQPKEEEPVTAEVKQHPHRNK